MKKPGLHTKWGKIIPSLNREMGVIRAKSAVIAGKGKLYKMAKSGVPGPDEQQFRSPQ